MNPGRLGDLGRQVPAGRSVWLGGGWLGPRAFVLRSSEILPRSPRLRRRMANAPPTHEEWRTMAANAAAAEQAGAWRHERVRGQSASTHWILDWALGWTAG